jgi:hypothetical protein
MMGGGEASTGGQKSGGEPREKKGFGLDDALKLLK